MNKKHTPKELRIAFDRLPEKVKDSILSSNIDTALRNISNKYHINIAQAAQLEDELTYVMYGLERSEKFLKNIKEELKLNDATASAIAKDLEDVVFKPIKKDLMMIHEPNYVPQTTESSDDSYYEFMNRIYRRLEEVGDDDEMLAMKKNIYKFATPEDTLEDVIKKANGELVTTSSKPKAGYLLSGVKINDRPEVEMLIKNPPQGTLSNTINLRKNRLEDEGPRSIDTSSFLIKENREVSKEISKDSEIPFRKSVPSPVKIEEPEKEEPILDLDSDEPTIEQLTPKDIRKTPTTQPASEIRIPLKRPEEKNESSSTITEAPETSTPSSEPSIMEKTLSGPVVSKSESSPAKLETPFKKPDVETKPVNTQYFGTKDPYRESVE